MTTSISICIPAYRGKHLSQAIESALNQTHKAKEVIVIDDNSPDNLEEIVAPYLDLGVIYIRNGKNLGVPANYEIALEKATSDYVMILGDHDALLPSFIEVVTKFVEQNPDIGFVFWNSVSIDDTNTVIREHSHDFPCIMKGRKIARLIVTHVAIPMTLVTLIQKKALDNLPKPWFNPDYWWYADHHLWIRLALNSNVGFIKKPIVLRRSYEDGHYLSDKQWQAQSMCKRIREENWHLAYPKPSLYSCIGRLRHSIARDKAGLMLLLSKRLHGVNKRDALPPSNLRPFPFSPFGRAIAAVLNQVPVVFLRFWKWIRILSKRNQLR